MNIRGFEFTKKRVVIGLIVLFVIFAVFAIYFNFISVKKCANFECFQKAMFNCDKVSYINDEPLATWKYDLLGSKAGDCNVRVTLLQLKQGSASMENLQGREMICSEIKGSTNYPGKSLGDCHGRLKEELLQTIVDKLHINILNNLDVIKQNLNNASDF